MNFKNIIINLFIIALASFIAFIYSAHKDYTDRMTLEEYKPYLFDNKMEKYTIPKPLFSQKDYNIFLSLVIPAYNEEKRLSPSIEKNINFFNKKGFIYEIIIVNDGSTDNTLTIIKELMKKYSNVTILGVSYKRNGGKGFAVKTGMQYARGKYILMLDSDSATQIDGYDNLYNSIKDDDFSLAIGSRKILTENVNRVWYRDLLGMANNFFVRNIVGIGDIKDTQCGFKLFTRKSAKIIFANTHIVRWAFDVDVLYIARKAKIRVKEISVNWQEMKGSKLVLVPAIISFIRDFSSMIVFYNLKIWKINLNIN